MVIYPRRRSDVTTREINGEILILDRQNEKLHQLNNTAGYVWMRCDGNSSITDIASSMANEYGIDLPRVSQDVETILSQLVDLNLLEVVQNTGEHSR